MRMYVYVGNATYPTVIETNLAWALPYWTSRKQLNDQIKWRIK